MPTQTVKTSKKNLAGGKGHKRQAGKENGRHRRNRELAQDYVDDISDGVAVTEVQLARVTKLMGSGRMEILTQTGATLIAGIKGSLKCRGARRADNPIAAFVGSFVLLQTEDYVMQIVAILNRGQVKSISDSDHFADAPKGFFSESTGAEDEEGGFEWDEEDTTPSEGMNVDAI